MTLGAWLHKHFDTIELSNLLTCYNKQPCCRRQALLSQTGCAMLRVCQCRAQSSIITYFRFRFTAAHNYILFSSAYSLTRGDLCGKQACTVTVIHYCTVDRQLWIAHCSSHPLIARYSSRIAICSTPHLRSTPPLGSLHRNIAMTFGMEKLQWLGYPKVKKN